MKDFYMTLLSNSSMDYYPENKTGTYNVQLPRYMCLEGEWEVGLTEIQYPFTFFTVERGMNEIEIKYIKATEEYAKHREQLHKEGKKVKHEKSHENIKEKVVILEGFYKEIRDVVESINSAIAEKTGQNNFFNYDLRANRVRAMNEVIAEGEKVIISCKLSAKLGQMFGYQSEVDGSENQISVPVDSTHAPDVVNMNMGIPDKMLIYCDILEPQLFGDKCSKVLASVITRASGGPPYFAQPMREVFNPITYVPLQKKKFESVGIDIRNVEERLFPFRYGTSSVKLHFKRVRGNY